VVPALLISGEPSSEGECIQILESTYALHCLFKSLTICQPNGVIIMGGLSLGARSFAGRKVKGLVLRFGVPMIYRPLPRLL